jgi:hypothetical protein
MISQEKETKLRASMRINETVQPLSNSLQISGGGMRSSQKIQQREFFETKNTIIAHNSLSNISTKKKK